MLPWHHRVVASPLRSCPFLALALILSTMACDRPASDLSPIASSQPPEALDQDVHSYGNPSEVIVRHLDLEWDVRFDRHTLDGTATLEIERIEASADRVRLDTRDLSISAVALSDDGREWSPTTFTLGDADPMLGAPLEIVLTPAATSVRVTYVTSPTASGVQWLEPSQTAGKQHPFMFTQSQAIHARSWIPLQDSPGVRVTYRATVRTPPGLRAVMSAAHEAGAPPDGEFRFDMRQPIPAYLIALAVGDLDFRAMTPRTGVYAEPSVVDSAAAEFDDTEAMMVATERLYGPYRWERYDLLVLPPSFPFGGMENPRLTFATPTIIAGDKSLVVLVAHELAHSWSGNLVTNATWRDFWLNEGFTVYLERRILEEVFGRARVDMEATLDRATLENELARLKAPDQILHVDLTGRDPDDGMTQVPYLKGELLLRLLENTVGRERFDRFLREYFDHFAFRSITTGDFVAYLQEQLLRGVEAGVVDALQLDTWLEQPGLPTNAPRSESDALTLVKAHADTWATGDVAAHTLDTTAWTTQEWLHFLTSLPDSLSAEQMQELDTAFALTAAGNSEVAHLWLLTAIRNQYAPAYPRLESYLVEIGRRKLIKPLYEELVKTADGRARAEAIYERARPGYHPISASSIDDVLGH
ncbi:MAG: M1 family metallopeptidase [Acidobacteria bacterium]|nr:M1 family metallopeptidase [Acidobacteriota bacterium]